MGVLLVSFFTAVRIVRDMTAPEKNWFCVLGDFPSTPRSVTKEKPGSPPRPVSAD